MEKENVIENEFDFSMEFLRLENNQKNKVYSPFSILYALKMLSEGAKGRTKEQVDFVIKDFDMTPYSNIDSVFSLANAIYIRDAYAKCVKDGYKNKLIGDYGAGVFFDSFDNATQINDWISHRTFGLIPNMITDDMVKDSMMLLINALVIDMEWIHPFLTMDTEGDKFYLEDGFSMEATVMHQKNIPYYQDDTVTAVKLDLKNYEDMQLEFIAVMPKEKLSDYIMTFSKNDFDGIMENMVYPSYLSSVHLYIPKFSFNYDLKLKNDLMHMGITDAFTYDLADLSNMYEIAVADDKLFFSDVLHKAKIDFTEEGIKAAAVTVFCMKEGAIREKEAPPIIININKPFLYFIRDKFTGQILFVGTVYRPNSWADDKDDYREEEYYF